ncbi:MAG: RES domain-containing protein [Crocinitomicaceae bacterium]|nr:RES domain-containing protein [Crocinitomicaceae bacterium]
MTFDEILKLDLIRLPITPNKDENYEKQLTEILQEMLIHVKESQHLSNRDYFDQEEFKRRFEVLTQGVLSALYFYYAGSPVKAYFEFSKAIKDSNFLGYLPPTAGFEKDTNFYRTRISHSNYALNKEDLFHVPFQKRRKLSTQRYSIPGFPTLYLSSSMHVAWEEMRRPDFKKIQAVRLLNKVYLRCIDLTTDKYKRSYEFNPPSWMATDKESDDLYAVMAWPVIAACSFKVGNASDAFKPEYIIPQLLLQFVQQNPDIHGVKFSSTHIDLNNENMNGQMYNLAIPVRENTPSGHCPQLTKMFHSTEVLSSQVVDLSSGDGQMWAPHEEVKKRTQTIELIKGIGTQYPYTKFGIMESTLLHMDVGPID